MRSQRPLLLRTLVKLTVKQRVRDMVEAATRAHRTNDLCDHENRRFRTFLFMFANVLLHEIGHVLVTFLTKGKTGTPQHVRPQLAGYSMPGTGEAGRSLETILFGGTQEYYRDLDDDDSQVSPHDGFSLYSIAITLKNELTLSLAWYSSYSHRARRPPNLASINR